MILGYFYVKIVLLIILSIILYVRVSAKAKSQVISEDNTRMKRKVKNENFYLESLFIVKNQPSFVFIINYEDGIAIKLSPDDTKTISLGFLAKEGLVRLRQNGSVDEENLLGSFVSIINQESDIKRINAYKTFFEKNGYLNSIKNNKPLIITLKELDNQNRLLSQLLALSSKLSQGNRLNVEDTISIIQFLMFHRGTNQSPHKLSTIILNTSNFLSAQKRKSLDETGKITIFDSARNTNVTLDSEFYYDFLHSNDVEFKAMRANPYFKSLYELYVLGNFKFDDIEKKAIDVFVNYYFCKRDKSDNSFLKPALFQVAKDTFKEEIDYYVKNIKPSYNKEKMSPSWNVEDLLTALYFSLFYMNPEVEIYRICEYCHKPFKLDKSTSTKKIYCSDKCRNCASQRKYRMTHKKRGT